MDVYERVMSALSHESVNSRQVGRWFVASVLVVYAANANARGETRIGYQRIADLLNVPVRDVRHARRALVDAGVLEPNDRTGRAAGHRVHLAEWDDASQPAGYPAGSADTKLRDNLRDERAGQPAGYPAPALLGSAPPPRADAGQPTAPIASSDTADESGGERHPHHGNATAALTTLAGERRLGITVDELLDDAYGLGRGDPWIGYMAIKALTDDVRGLHDISAGVRYRIRAARGGER